MEVENRAAPSACINVVRESFPGGIECKDTNS